MSIKIYNPFVFQGNFKKKNYFEGWYFKHTTADQEQTWSFIPGISLNNNDSHCFIQMVDGSSGSSEYIRYPLEKFRFNSKKRLITVHESTFSEYHTEINIDSPDRHIKGRINYSGNIPYSKTIFSPGIMGWYSFVPRMECKHGVISVNHRLSGGLSFNGISLSFDGGKGYIEKDWGTSFPEAWIWIQSNNFSSEETSFFFSIAKIPWLGSFFIGFISFLYFNNRFYKFCTYNGAKVTSIRNEKGRIRITLENKNHILQIDTLRKDYAELKAPSMGEMTRKIKESINSQVSLRLLGPGGKLMFDDTGRAAGVEIIDKMFEYL